MSGKNPIRLAYVLDTFSVGGTEINAVRTAEQLVAAGFELSIYHIAADGPIRPRYEALGCSMMHLPLSNLYGPASIRTGRRLTASLRERAIDIVQTHDVYTNIFGLPHARLSTDALVIGSRRWGRNVFPARLNFLNRHACRFAHRVLANSDAVADIVASDDRIPAARVFTVPNFVDDALFDAAADTAGLRGRLGISDTATVFGIVARLEPVKNHSMLLRAFASLNGETHLVVAGDGSQRAALESLAADLDIGPRVSFLGEVAAGAALQKDVDVCVLCSHDEGFPNAVVEGMAAGRAVVATAVGGVVDAVADGTTGLLVPPGDVTALAAAMQRLCDDRDFREDLGARARSIARERYSRSSVIRLISDTYMAFLREKRGSVSRG